MHVPEHLFELLIIYFFIISKLEEPKIIEILKSVPENLKDKIMSTYDMLIEKGEKRGAYYTQYENIRNMLLKGFTEAVICKALNVSQDLIMKVKEELQ